MSRVASVAEHPDVLPVIDADAATDRSLAAPPERRALRRLRPKGNTKATEAQLRRSQVTTAAMAGGTPSEPAQDWRQQLHEGQRSKAASTVSRRGHTHNSGSGFGLA
jgi:hypothetical protein